MCCLGPAGSTRKLICGSPVLRGSFCVTADSWSCLSRRQELEKKERPFVLVSVRCVLVLNPVNGLLGPEGCLGIYSLEVCRLYIFVAMNSIPVVDMLRSFCTCTLNYVSKLGGTCNFEGCLICIGLGNIFQAPAFYSEMYVCELLMLFNQAGFQSVN